MGGVIEVIVPALNLHNRRCVDQPSREAGASSRGAQTPFQHIARAKLAADLPRIVGCTSSGKPGPTRNQDHLAQLHSSVDTSSVMPSPRISRLGAPDRLVKGKTMIAGRPQRSLPMWSNCSPNLFG